MTCNAGLWWSATSPAAMGPITIGLGWLGMGTGMMLGRDGIGGGGRGEARRWDLVQMRKVLGAKYCSTFICIW